MTLSIYPGDALKALDDGTLRGYLVVFGDDDATDLEGDYFTLDTNFGAAKSTPIYLNHCLPMETKDGRTVVVDDPIGEGQLSIDDHGVVIEAILYEAEKYAAYLSRMGWSSGTAPHLVKALATGKSRRITRWPLGLDASLTPTPAEPRTLRRAVRNIDANLEARAEATEVAPRAGRRRIITTIWR